MKIINLKRARFKYYSNDIEKLADQGYAKMQLTTSILESKENDDVVKCEIEYSLNLNSKEISDNIDNEKEETDAYVSGRYEIIIESKNQPEEKQIEFASENVEPYIRRDIVEFCKEIQIPTFTLPYRFWMQNGQN